MKKTAISCLLLVLVGCAHEVPMGTAFKKPEQLKLNSASHWEILAHNEAALIMKTLKNSSTLPLFIKEPANSFPFAKSYQHLLTSNLVAQGATVTTQQEFNSATVTYSVDVIKHGAHYKDMMGLLTPLAHGVYYLTSTVLGKGVEDVTTTGIEIVKAPFYSAIEQVKPSLTTPVEVVITTQIIMGNLVLSSDSRVYYVDQGNLSQYTYRAPDAVPHRFTVSDLQ